MTHIESAAKYIREWVTAGRPHMEWMGSNLPAARDAVIKALEMKTNFFWRGTNRQEEIQDVKNGVQIISKNHVDNTMECGMSVCDSLATVWAYNYKYAYKCVGDVCSAGSDGEPVIVNVHPVSDLYDAQVAIENDECRALQIERINEIAIAAEVDAELVQWIAART